MFHHRSLLTVGLLALFGSTAGKAWAIAGGCIVLIESLIAVKKRYFSGRN